MTTKKAAIDKFGEDTTVKGAYTDEFPKFGPKMTEADCEAVLAEVVDFGRFLEAGKRFGRVYAKDPDGGFEWRFGSRREWESTRDNILVIYGPPRRKYPTKTTIAPVPAPPVLKKAPEPFKDGKPKKARLGSRNAGVYQESAEKPMLLIAFETILGYQLPDDNKPVWRDILFSDLWASDKVRFMAETKREFQKYYGVGSTVEVGQFVRVLSEYGYSEKAGAAPYSFLHQPQKVG